MQISGNLATEERLAWIRSELRAEGQLQIRAVARELRVSDMTIRRDLQELEAVGVLRRVRGGAVAVGPVSFADRHRQHAQAKAKIATKLLPMVPANGAIGFDASSTILRLASAIQSGRDLQIVTNSAETFGSLQDKPGVRAILTGGELDRRTGSLVGPFACRAAGNLLLGRFFLSAAGLDPTVGTSEACLEEAEVKRALSATASEVVLAVDASKLGARGLALAIGWDTVTALVTDLNPADPRLEPYRDLAEII